MPITIDQLITEVRRLAAEKPDYVYTPAFNDKTTIACWYQAPGKEHCIFGQALANIGVTVPYDNEGSRIRLLITSMDAIEHTRDEKKLDWCTNAQNAQDRGNSWSQAILDADGMAEMRVGP
jgi:hypothetical protein